MRNAWIDVKVAMPDDELTVMVAVVGANEPVWLGYHDGDGWREISGAPIEVTHWMPIPEPPTAGAQR